MMEALVDKIKSITPGDLTESPVTTAWDDDIGTKIQGKLDQLDIAILIQFPSSKAVGDPSAGTWEMDAKITIESNGVTRQDSIDSFAFAEKLPPILFGFSPDIPENVVNFPYFSFYPTLLLHIRNGNNLVHHISLKAKFNLK